MCRRFFFFLFLIVIGLAAGFLWFIHETAQPHVFPDPKKIPASVAQAAQNRLAQALGLDSGAPKARVASAPTVSSPNTAASSQAITIHLSEDDINTTLATNPDIKQQMAQRGIKAAQLSFAPPNLVTAYVKVVYHDQPAVAEVTGALSADPTGALQFTAQAAKVSGVPVPLQSAQKVIDKAKAELLPRATAVLPLVVQQVRVQGKEIYFTGPAKKKQAPVE